MSTVAVFDEQGRCKYVVNAEDNSADFGSQPAVATVSDATDPNTIWFDHVSSRVMARTPFPVSVSMNKITGVPQGTAVYVGSECVVVTEGLIEFEVDYPQVLRVVMTHVRHTDMTIEVPCEV